jgi:hypothetical protein
MRDWNFRAMYGAWDALKNVDRKYPNHKLNWSAYVSGPRESRRLLGDVLLTKEDIVGGRAFPDACVPCTWSIDLHLPDPKYEKGFEGNAFISRAHYTAYKRPYWAPYRCLYSRNVPNLFMAGRDVSVSHEALGAVRVMRTCGMMGEVVGMAASVCKRHACDPRDVHAKYLEELQSLLNRGVGKPPVPRAADPDAPRAAVAAPPPPAWLAQAGPNLARNAKVTASNSSDAANSPPALVNDGMCDFADNAGRWLSDRQPPHQVELAWEQPQRVSAVRILSGYLRDGELIAPLTDFVVQYHDGQQWQDLPGAKAEGNTAIDWHARFAAVSASRLRLTVTAAPGNVSRIWEIEVY